MKLLKLGLAALSLLCIIDMPYGYYQLYRFLALGVFLYLAYEEQDKKEWMIVWLMSSPQFHSKNTQNPCINRGFHFSVKTFVKTFFYFIIY